MKQNHHDEANWTDRKTSKHYLNYHALNVLFLWSIFHLSHWRFWTTECASHPPYWITNSFPSFTMMFTPVTSPDVRVRTYPTYRIFFLWKAQWWIHIDTVDTESFSIFNGSTRSKKGIIAFCTDFELTYERTHLWLADLSKCNSLIYLCFMETLLKQA